MRTCLIFMKTNKTCTTNVNIYENVHLSKVFKEKKIVQNISGYGEQILAKHHCKGLNISRLVVSQAIS